ncbi:MAG: hypothetical protein IJ435_03595 [Clostridia bacterium]|nr:hypothetical protein [Clostridia bacterium]
MQVCKNAHILTINEKGLFLDDMNMRRVIDYKLVHGDMGPSLTITMDVIVGGDIKFEEAEAVDINLDEAVRNAVMKSGTNDTGRGKKLMQIPLMLPIVSFIIAIAALIMKIMR